MGEKETASSEEAERLKSKTKSNQSNDRMDAGDEGTLDPDSDDDALAGGSDPAASGEAERVLKNKTKSNQSNDRLDPDSDGDGVEAAINNTKSNIKNLADVEGGGATHEDDREAGAAKLAPERPVRSEIAIGDPGVNGNFTGNSQGIAVGDEGVPADKPSPKSK